MFKLTEETAKEYKVEFHDSGYEWMVFYAELKSETDDGYIVEELGGEYPTTERFEFL